MATRLSDRPRLGPPGRRVEEEISALSTMPDLATLAICPDHADSLSAVGRLAEDVLGAAVDQAARHLLTHQRPDGHWVFELEADATIPAEFVMLKRFFGVVEPDREARIGRYLRRLQELEAPTC